MAQPPFQPMRETQAKPASPSPLVQPSFKPMMESQAKPASPVPAPILKTASTTPNGNGQHQHQQQHVQFKTEATQQQQQQQTIPIPVNVLNNNNNSLHNPPPADTFTDQSGTVTNVGPGQNVSAPRRGRGVLQQQQPGMRVPMCGSCNNQIRCSYIGECLSCALLTPYAYSLHETQKLTF